MVRILSLIIEVVELLVLLSFVVGSLKWVIARLLPSRAPVSDCRDLVPAETKHAQ